MTPEDTEQIVVAVVDDETAFCDAIAECLNDEPDVICGGTARTPHQARQLVAEVQPDVLLFDGVRFHDRWPDERRIDPMELAAELMQRSPSMHMLIWTSWVDPDPSEMQSMQLRMAAIRAGAKDLLSKGMGLADVLDKIRTTVRTPPRVPDPALWPDVQPHIPDDDWATAELTPAQARWASILAQSFKLGMTVQEVATQHNARVNNVRGYVQALHKAWGIKNQVQLVDEAERRGLLQRGGKRQQPGMTEAADEAGLQTVVLTCMDARLENLSGLGDFDTTHIVRNAGGRVTDDAVRSLAASCTLGAQRIIVAHHTDCRMAQVTEDELRESMPDPVAAKSVQFRTIADPDSALREDVERLVRSPLLPGGTEILGLVYDVHAHSAAAVLTATVGAPPIAQSAA